jgi:hypothetical protein
MALCIRRRLIGPRCRFLWTGLRPRGQHRLAQALLEFSQAVRLTLPDDDPLPAQPGERLGIRGVPLPVSLQLRRPVSVIALWNVALAAVVSVPEAAVN